MSTLEEKVWQTTAVQNLVRYAPSGTYFARFRVAGRLVWKSLKTTTFSVAKQRLPETIRDHRAKLESITAFAEGKMTFGVAAEVYLRRVHTSVSLKPRSKDYRDMMIDFIRRSWPSLFETEVRRISQRDCEDWLCRFQQRYSPSVVNNSIGTLRAVFDEAISTDARFNNPAARFDKSDLSFRRAKSSCVSSTKSELRARVSQEIARIWCAFLPTAACGSARRDMSRGPIPTSSDISSMCAAIQ